MGSKDGLKLIMMAGNTDWVSMIVFHRRRVKLIGPATSNK